MKLRQLTGLDSIFLSAETPQSPLHMMGILLLDPETIPGGYAFDRFRDFFASRLHLIPPLQRRLVEVPFGLGRPYWLEAEDLSIDDHVLRATLPAPGGREQLAAMAAEMNEGTLPRDRPLWQMRVVEGLADGRIAVLAKLHHAMMDGMAGMQFMTALFSRSAEPAPIASASPRGRHLRVPERRELLGRALFGLARRPWKIAKASATTAVRAVKQGRGHPERPDVEPLETPRTLLNGPAGRRRRAAYCSISVDTVRGVAAAADATVNDIVLAVVAGALRDTLLAEGALPEAPLVAGVPVSLHEAGDGLANALSAMFTPLHTDERDPVSRLRKIRDGARAAKTERRETGGMPFDLWADVPLPLEVSIVSRLYTGLGLAARLPLLCNCVVSNVPGPPVPLYLGGARLVGIHPLGPIFDGMTLNVTVLGREDALDVGINSAAEGLRDPWALARRIPEELATLTRELLPEAGTPSPSPGTSSAHGATLAR